MAVPQGQRNCPSCPTNSESVQEFLHDPLAQPGEPGKLADRKSIIPQLKDQLPLRFGGQGNKIQGSLKPRQFADQFPCISVTQPAFPVHIQQLLLPRLAQVSLQLRRDLRRVQGPVLIGYEDAIAAPAVLADILAQPRLDRILIDVSECGEKVFVGFHGLAAKAVLKEMPRALVFPVIPPDIPDPDALHEGG